MLDFNIFNHKKEILLFHYFASQENIVHKCRSTYGYLWIVSAYFIRPKILYKDTNKTIQGRRWIIIVSVHGGAI